MAIGNQQLANNVVNSFKEKLRDEAREQISPAQYEELALMIQRALSEKTGDVIEQFENLVCQLRREIDKPQLGL